MTSLNQMAAYALLPLIWSGAVSAVSVTEAALDRISRFDRTINGYLSVLTDQALEVAANVDSRIARGEPVGALAGIPIAIKDAICTQGVQTTCGSKILEGFVPPYDATVIARLRQADAVIVGKTNMDQFGMGSSNENSGFGLCRNPLDLARTPGGSSGGSAAVLAANEAILALGEDTGGSIRQPAAFCGVVGLKPTYGRVSRFGVISYASSFDQVGPMARNVEDCARLFGVIAGHDPKDSTSAFEPVPDYLETLKHGVSGLRIGVPDEYFAEGLDPEVRDRIQDSLRIFERSGAVIERVRLPHTEYAVATYYILVTAEASSNLARYDGVKYGYRTNLGAIETTDDELDEMYVRTRSEGFGLETRRRIMLGTYVLSAGYYDAYYSKAQQVRTLIKGDFDRVFERVDVLVTPTTPTPAFLIGEKINDPLQMYLSDIYTVPINLAGVPAISVPCGRSSAGLPIGLQIVGPPFGEATVLRTAYAFEYYSECNPRR